MKKLSLYLLVTTLVLSMGVNAMNPAAFAFGYAGSMINARWQEVKEITTSTAQKSWNVTKQSAASARSFIQKHKSESVEKKIEKDLLRIDDKVKKAYNAIDDKYYLSNAIFQWYQAGYALYLRTVDSTGEYAHEAKRIVTASPHLFFCSVLAVGGSYMAWKHYRSMNQADFSAQT
ncbi:MAG: hypothetical protein WCE21_04285 [Candidatus Babeliales bacterium]